MDISRPAIPSRIAAVGVGGMGRNYLDGCKAENIVAVCDLDWTRPTTQGVFQKFPSAACYRDFRQMFDKEEKNFDALIMAAPDHWHAILLMQAIQMKKHIYGAKPVAHSIGEVRKVRQALISQPQAHHQGKHPGFPHQLCPRYHGTAVERRHRTRSGSPRLDGAPDLSL